MIEHSDFDGAQSSDELLGDVPIGRAGLWLPARVVVGEDAGRRVDAQRCLDHLARIHRSAGDGAAEQTLGAEDAVALVQPEDVKLFVVEAADACAQKVGCVLGRAQAALPLNAPAEDVFRSCQHVGFAQGARARVVAEDVADQAHGVLPRRGMRLGDTRAPPMSAVCTARP